MHIQGAYPLWLHIYRDYILGHPPSERRAHVSAEARAQRSPHAVRLQLVRVLFSCIALLPALSSAPRIFASGHSAWILSS